MKKVFVLNGHPGATSLCGAIASEVADGAQEAGHTVRWINLSDVEFDLNLLHHDPNDQPLEPDLQTIWDAFEWCDHVVIVHPLWWGSAPAKLKGVFDRALRPRSAYAYKKGKSLPEGLLKGRTAEVIITSDTPTWFYRLAYSTAWSRILRRQILGFCGLKVGKIRNFGPIRNSSDAKRATYLRQAHAIGQAIQ